MGISYKNIYGTFEDALQSTLQDIKNHGHNTSPRGRGSKELLGHSFYILDPRNRIIGLASRKLNPFYLVGNFLWIMKQSNELDIIKYYNPKGTMFSDDGKTLRGAYGKRIFDFDGVNQWYQAIRELKLDPDSRRAIITFHLPQHDWSGSLDTPCTANIQFFIRNNQLHMINHMRSQSAAFVMPFDIFLMTMLHETMARELEVDLGYYQHFCGSIHYFDNEITMIDKLIESNDFTPGMEDMPLGSNIIYIKKLLEFEEFAREYTLKQFSKVMLADEKLLTNKLLELNLPSYWLCFGEVLIVKALEYTGLKVYKVKAYVDELERNPFQKLLLQMIQ